MTVVVGGGGGGTTLPRDRSIDLFGDRTTGSADRSSRQDPDTTLTGLDSPARPLPRLPAIDDDGDDMLAITTRSAASCCRLPDADDGGGLAAVWPTRDWLSTGVV